MDPDSGVVVARSAAGNAVVLGLLKCGKVWLCPVCSAKIRNARAQEITRAVVKWIGDGGTAYLVTFTARHAASDRLDALMGALQGTRPTKTESRKPGAYQRLITGGTWAGRPDRGQDGIRDRIGYVGMIRATEVTRSEANGWHPHLHAIVFVGGRTEGTRGDKHVTGVFTPGGPALSEWQDYWRAAWTNALRRADPRFTPSDEHGVKFDPLRTAADATEVGQYIAKLQEGSTAINPANELARADLKRGKGGSITPFQLLGRIGDLMGGAAPDVTEGYGTLDQCRAWWREYEDATKGRRAIEWTRYLRPLLGLDGDDTEEADLDLLFEEDGAFEFSAGIGVAGESWHKVTGRALDLAVTEAVEADDMPGAVELVEAAGVKSGAVQMLTPDRLSEIRENQVAALAKRREAAASRAAIERAGDAGRG